MSQSKSLAACPARRRGRAPPPVRWAAGRRRSDSLPDARRRASSRALQVVEGRARPAALRSRPRSAPLEPEVRKAAHGEGREVETPELRSRAGLPGARLAKTDIYIWLPAGDNAVTPRRAARRPREVARRGQAAGRSTSTGSAARVDRRRPGRRALGRIRRASMSMRSTSTTPSSRPTAGQCHRQAALGRSARDDAGRAPTSASSVGDRPFNKQDGDASKARTATARVRVDREVELPAGVLRVAPIESSVNGVHRDPEGALRRRRVVTGLGWSSPTARS